MAKMKEYKTPKSKLPYHRRWVTINERCNNKAFASYEVYGGKGIRVCIEWCIENEKGYINFAKWINSELEKHPELKGTRFKIGRLDISKNYEPKNCHLTTNSVVCQNRSCGKLTVKKVADARAHKRKFPDTPLSYFETLLGVSITTASRSLRGITWSNVNSIEPPISF